MPRAGAGSRTVKRKMGMQGAERERERGREGNQQRERQGLDQRNQRREREARRGRWNPPDLEGDKYYMSH